MKIGISVLSTGHLKITEAIKKARELDFELVEIFGDFLFFDNSPFRETSKEIGRVAKEEGVELTIHLPALDLNTGSLKGGVYKLTREENITALNFAAEAGVKLAVFHPASAPVCFQPILKAVEERMEKLLGDLLVIANSLDIIIAVENLGVEETWMVNKPDKMLKLINTFDSELKVALDFGHAHIAKLTQEFIDTLKTHIKHLHLHDNFGFTDEHLPVGTGSLPYDNFKSFLKGFQGTAIMEIFSFKDPINDIKISLENLKRILAD
ncbi:MAG: D-tagatose 3-epimerase [candidate division WS2 bacterium]|uniref:D-tagatose 3-epimerase n=1 Tax=Psychracetigena formicireducens TaxID=2986056 RepID=A0A9E2BJ02_PSYF1|nr:D-tagatose 3-epimerase [Candidatus Psychracetigena formicireducens]MBT9145075.1 D-tagatose 3-epimerase [Candidatus Psychracetigena formicireducens]